MERATAKCNNFNVSSIEVTALSHGTCQILVTNIFLFFIDTLIVSDTVN